MTHDTRLLGSREATDVSKSAKSKVYDNDVALHLAYRPTDCLQALCFRGIHSIMQSAE